MTLSTVCAPGCAGASALAVLPCLAHSPATARPRALEEMALRRGREGFRASLRGLPLGLALASLLLAASPAQAGCGAATCGVNTEQEIQPWEEGLVTRLDLRYENANQDQPRSGSSAVPFGRVRRHHDERRTVGQQLRLGVDVALDPTWGLSAQVPVTLDRVHDHVHNHRGKAYSDRWSLAGLGDVRLLGRYQLPRDKEMDMAWGLRFGVKLPTGGTAAGNAAGQVAERSLQLGTGSTDVVLGAYLNQRLGEHSAWFASLTGQQALWSRGGFQPGHSLALDVGFTHRLDERWTGFLQGNFWVQGQDHGAAAEPSSGSASFSVTPGLGVRLSRDAQLYALVQVPVWQRVNDVQLGRPVSLAVGLNVKL